MPSPNSTPQPSLVVNTPKVLSMESQLKYIAHEWDICSFDLIDDKLFCSNSIFMFDIVNGSTKALNHVASHMKVKKCNFSAFILNCLASNSDIFLTEVLKHNPELDFYIRRGVSMETLLLFSKHRMGDKIISLIRSFGMMTEEFNYEVYNWIMRMGTSLIGELVSNAKNHIDYPLAVKIIGDINGKYRGEGIHKTNVEMMIKSVTDEVMAGLKPDVRAQFEK